MWNERQRAQKIDVDLARIKRELADQDRELEALMAEHYVTHRELDALDAARPVEVSLPDRGPDSEAEAPPRRGVAARKPTPDFQGRFVVRG